MSTLLAKDHVCVLSPTYTQFVLVPPLRTFPVVCITATQTLAVTAFPPSCSQRQSSNGDELRNKHPHVGPPVPTVSWHSITLELAWRLTVKSPGGHHFQEQGQKPSVTQSYSPKQCGNTRNYAAPVKLVGNRRWNMKSQLLEKHTDVCNYSEIGPYCVHGLSVVCVKIVCRLLSSLLFNYYVPLMSLSTLPACHQCCVTWPVLIFSADF